MFTTEAAERSSQKLNSENDFKLYMDIEEDNLSSIGIGVFSKPMTNRLL